MDLYEKAPVTYSIWLIPDEQCSKTISNLITRFSDHLGGPIFNAHVTLIGGLLGNEMDLGIKAKSLSTALSPFNVIFEKISFFEEYFRSVFVQIKLTDKLKYSRNLACKKFNYYEKNYFPHLSLAYGDYNILTKKQMIKKIDDIPKGFLADKICLSLNDEINLNWEIIDYYDLND